MLIKRIKLQAYPPMSIWKMLPHLVPLLSACAGDTNKSAEIANKAMVDMADNANKMGTDMGSIQNAYQGFAKQNYTMLDNLKSGYGGTKEEMERLLKDAQAITGTKYDLKQLSGCDISYRSNTG